MVAQRLKIFRGAATSTAIQEVENQVNEWLEDLPNTVVIDRTETVVVAVASGPSGIASHITISVWYSPGPANT